MHAVVLFSRLPSALVLAGALAACGDDAERHWKLDDSGQRYDFEVKCDADPAMGLQVL